MKTYSRAHNVALTVALTLAAGNALAQSHHHLPAGKPAPMSNMQDMPCMKDMPPHMMMPMHTGMAASNSPVVAELEAANLKMHQNMSITYTGNADADFLAGMIPHHQGAVDMAQVALRYGTDPQVRRLAMEIIRAQNLEIRWMKSYLAQLQAKGIRPTAAHGQPQAGFHDSHWAGQTWLGER